MYHAGQALSVVQVTPHRSALPVAAACRAGPPGGWPASGCPARLRALPPPAGSPAPAAARSTQRRAAQPMCDTMMPGTG